MKSDILVIVRAFLEKYFITTILSIVLAMVMYLLLPEKFFITNRLGVIGFLVFVFLVMFLVIRFIIWGYEKLKNNKHEREYDKKKEKETYEEIKKFTDSLNETEYEILIRWVKNGNIPYVKNQSFDLGIYGGGLFTNFEIVNKTEIQEKDGEFLITKMQYRLKDEIYECLKYYYNKYGTISNFKR